MKLKKTILGLAVVAVAGVNAWLANDVMSAKNDLSLLNLENIADAQEPGNGGDCGGVYVINSWSQCCNAGGIAKFYECSDGYTYYYGCENKNANVGCENCMPGDNSPVRGQGEKFYNYSKTR